MMSYLIIMGGFVKCLVSALMLCTAWAKQPNVVILFADDLGYGDLACYGHPTSLTPNLDRMSEEGLLFTQFYTGAPVCSPSRAALMTSRYHPRSGVYPGVFFPDDVGGLPLNETTMAESLKSVGYSTAIVGKWHLGVGKDGMYLPTHQGFDYYMGIPYSHDMCPCDVCFYPNLKCSDPQNECNNNYVPCPVFENEKIIQQPVVKINLTEMYIDAATNFIKEKSEQSSPFLLYMAFQHTHKPQFSGKLATNSCIRGEFGDALAELDWGVGQILEELEKDGVSDNTFVFFTSDNGPSLEFRTHAGVQGALRCGKASTWDGGVRVPGIAWWPGKIRHGRTQELAATLDLFPTVMNLAGGKMPSVITDGVDMSPVLFENKESNRQNFVYYSQESTPQTGLYALRLRQYKAHFYTRGGLCRNDYPDEVCRGNYTLVAHSPPLLFNVDVDPSELYPLDPTEYADVLQEIETVKEDFESTMVWGESQVARGKDPSYEPCASPGCSPFPSCCHT